MGYVVKLNWGCLNGEKLEEALVKWEEKKKPRGFRKSKIHAKKTGGVK